MRARSAVPFVAVALFILVLSCGTPPAASPTSAPGGASAVTPAPAATSEPTAAPVASGPGKVNDRVVAGGTALTVTTVERKDALGEFLKPKEGNDYVVAEVLIENTGSEKIDYNPFYFSVKDGDGFESTIAISTDPQALKSGQLAGGEKARGTVAFEVKKTAKGIVLQYKPIIIGNVEPIRVDLGI